MFGDINEVSLLGNVTKDPDLRFTPSGTAVLSLGMATNRSYKHNEEWKDEVTFHNVTVWGNAQKLAEYIKKGTRIHVSGRISTDSWTDNGVTKYRTYITADRVLLVDRYNKPDGTTKQSESEDNTPGGGYEQVDPDDLPF